LARIFPVKYAPLVPPEISRDKHGLHGLERRCSSESSIRLRPFGEAQGYGGQVRFTAAVSNKAKDTAYVCSRHMKRKGPVFWHGLHGLHGLALSDYETSPLNLRMSLLCLPALQRGYLRQFEFNFSSQDL